jgi:hypothetical protein
VRHGYGGNNIDKKFNEAKEYPATKTDLAEVKADIIKWMFIFWVGQIAAAVAIVLLM